MADDITRDNPSLKPSIVNDRVVRAPFGELNIREVIEVAKDSNIDPTALIGLAKEMSSQMHIENMRYWELRDKKLEMDFRITQKNQDYALLLSVIATACGSLIAYLISPWAGVAIATAGAGVVGLSTGKRMLSRSKQSIEEPSASTVGTNAA